MKAFCAVNGITIALLLWCKVISAQPFYFTDTVAVITKTTAQSPAHWYLEIYNNTSTDTLLRWKTYFSNIPPQWTITFDDQNNYYPNLKTGDSADFVLYDSLAFPQKLIIGAFTNNTPGAGSVFFDIYDPANPSFFVTIEYIFYITLATQIQETEFYAESFQIYPDAIFFNNAQFRKVFITDIAGRIVVQGEIKNRMLGISGLPGGIYFLHLQTMDNKVFRKKIFR